MKRKVIVSAILSIALCLSLIAGSTFALFTSESNTNIAINSGKVEMIANIKNVQTWSLEDDKQQLGKTDGTFSLGGSAEFENSILSLDKIVPGDKVSFVLEGINNSNVPVLYRVNLQCLQGEKLMSVLQVSVNDKVYTGLSKYNTTWKMLKVSENMEEIEFSIELPKEVGNDYQDLNTKVLVTVEAVQGNAEVSGEEEVTTLTNSLKSLKEALNKKQNILMVEDIKGVASKGGYSKAGVTVSGVVFDGNGNTLEINDAGGTWDCAVYTQGGTIKNLTVKGAFRGIFTAGCSSDIIIDNVVIDDVCYTFNSDGANENFKVIVTNSTLNGWTSYAGNYKSVEFTNCTFGQGTGDYKYAFMRPYSPTTFTNCNFEANYEFDATKTLNTFVNCYCNGILITQENIVSLLGSYASNVVVANK